MRKMLSLATLLAMLCLSAWAVPNKAELDRRASNEHWTFHFKPDFKHHFKGLRPEALHALRANKRRVSFVAKDSPIPASYSLRSCITQIEDQGDCGSCWDFSTTTGLRDSHSCAGKGDPGRLSFNYLLNCATDMYGCDGGQPSAAHWMVNPSGPPKYGVDGPYTAKAGTCQKSTPAAMANAYHMLGDAKGVVHLKDIAYVIGVLHRPVVITVAATSTWEAYDGGVYNACDGGPADTNHMVMFMEYDCESGVTSDGKYCAFDANGDLPPGIGLTGIKNSWNTSWGEQGLMRTKWSNSKGEKCNAAGEDSFYFDVDPPAPTNPLSCAVKAEPTQVIYGDMVTFTITSVGAYSAVVNGQAVSVPTGTDDEIAAPGGTLPVTMPVTATVRSADGRTASCQTTYQVVAVTPPAPPNPPPTPPTPPTPPVPPAPPAPNASVPWWLWVIVGVVGVVLLAFEMLSKKSGQ